VHIHSISPRSILSVECLYILLVQHPSRFTCNNSQNTYSKPYLFRVQFGSEQCWPRVFNTHIDTFRAVSSSAGYSELRTSPVLDVILLAAYIFKLCRNSHALTVAKRIFSRSVWRINDLY